MTDLHWSWLAAPYALLSGVIALLGVSVVLLRGDRVLRLGVFGSVISALPWAVGQAIAACTSDPHKALRVLRLAQGPIGMLGPSLLIVLLGLAGQLERQRWLVRVSGLVGLVSMGASWLTAWVVPGVQVLPSGMYYIMPGPLTALHSSLFVLWVGIGFAIARRSAPRGERRRTFRMIVGVLAFVSLGALDSFLLYGIWGTYPIAWLPATFTAASALYLVMRTDFVRPRGFDRELALEGGLVILAFVALGVFAFVEGPSGAVVVLGAGAWTCATGAAWMIAEARPVRAIAERDLERFVAHVATVDREDEIRDQLAALWKSAIGMELTALWWRDGEAFVDATGVAWAIDREAAAWLVRTAEPLAMSDLATMRVGSVRDVIEGVGAAHGADVLVPLVDRDELVGLAEVRYALALREEERGLIAESARAAARALTFAAMSRASSRERETAREVEIADALRLQAAASRNIALGDWEVAAEYRPAARSTGAGWTAMELPDGRLAVLVTEAQAHGVAAALATAALTGAFAAATSTPKSLTLPSLLASLGATSEGVMRGGSPVAAFVAILDRRAHSIEYACAGHTGGALVGDAITMLGGTRDPGASLAGAIHKSATLPAGSLLVVASSALRDPQDLVWEAKLQALARAGGKPSVLVDEAAVAEDLLAVVVRAHGDLQGASPP